MDNYSEPLLPRLDDDSNKNLDGTEDAEIVIAFVGAVGVNLTYAEEAVRLKLEQVGYTVIRIRVTTDVLPKLDPSAGQTFHNDFARISKMMDIGTQARQSHGNEIIAQGVAAEIARSRPFKEKKTKVAYIVHSLKHPDEVRCLREIYPRGFYLIGVHSPPESRKKYLGTLRGIGGPEAKRLMDRDKKENRQSGQQLVDTFHLSDFFAGWEEHDDIEAQRKSKQLLENSLHRFVEVMFGQPSTSALAPPRLTPLPPVSTSRNPAIFYHYCYAVVPLPYAET